MRNYTVSKTSIIFTSVPHKFLFNHLITLMGDEDCTEAVMPLKDFLKLTQELTDIEYHRSGSGFPYLVYKGLFVLSSSSAEIKKQLELNE